ncbi:MbtH family protein [Streptomyces pinistramenti]|uniref:MbtH family protein n=1 Tax=Streptomyces pinistramenti TaxID=2884812 RepID=UPI001D0906D6|nr:MbtH family protein [Streptomyces pinistramenti]MCB5908819.1 MbtH family protein [Streptomyces pinistramenti]
MSNPFEDPEGTYLVLVNQNRQHSLWPEHLEPPQGWTVAHGADGYQASLDYIEEHWRDLSPQPTAGH